MALQAPAASYLRERIQHSSRMESRETLLRFQETKSKVLILF